MGLLTIGRVLLLHDIRQIWRIRIGSYLQILKFTAVTSAKREKNSSTHLDHSKRCRLCAKKKAAKP